MNPNDLETVHLRIREETIVKINTILEMHQVSPVVIYFNDFDSEIRELYDRYYEKAVHLNAKSIAIQHYREKMEQVTGFGDVRFWIKSINFNY